MQRSPFMQKCLHAADAEADLTDARAIDNRPYGFYRKNLYLPHTLFFVKIPAA